MLSYARLTITVGLIFVDLKEHIDDQLVSILIISSHSINDFFYGRYDIMLPGYRIAQTGPSFQYPEYNGCGQNPTTL